MIYLWTDERKTKGVDVLHPEDYETMTKKGGWTVYRRCWVCRDPQPLFFERGFPPCYVLYLPTGKGVFLCERHFMEAVKEHVHD